MVAERIAAVGLLTQRDVETLGPTFKRLWLVDDTPTFIDLLKRIDEADCELAGSSAPETQAVEQGE